MLLCAALISFVTGYRQKKPFRYTRHSIALAIVSLIAFIQPFAGTSALLFCTLTVSLVFQIEGLVMLAKSRQKQVATMVEKVELQD